MSDLRKTAIARGHRIDDDPSHLCDTAMPLANVGGHISHHAVSVDDNWVQRANAKPMVKTRRKAY